MFGFSKKKDEFIALNQKLGRFLNELRRQELEGESLRSETRMRLALPCILFPFDQVDGPQCYLVGISSDISLHGLSLFATEPLEKASYLLVFGIEDQRVFIKGECKRCLPAAFGSFNIGFEFKQILRENDYQAIRRAIAEIELSAVTMN